MVGVMAFVASRHVNAGPALAAEVVGQAAVAVFVFPAVSRAILVVNFALFVGAAVAIIGCVGGRVALALRPWKAQINTYLCNLFRGS